MARKHKARVPLTRRRQREGGRFVGTPLNYSVIVEARYAAVLTKAVDAMIAEAHTQVRGLYLAHAPATDATVAMDASLVAQARILVSAMTSRFQAFFTRLAPGAAAGMLKGVNAFSKTSLHSSLKEMSGGISLKTSVITGRVEESLKASIQANIGLIKSIPQEYFTDLQRVVMQNIQQGQGQAGVLEEVDKLGQVTKRRARLIASDQASKATTALNAARMRALGIKKFKWLHSSGSKEPRPLHVEMSGNVYELDNPPVIDEKTGERGLPGQLINCGCRMSPVIEFEE